MNILHRILPAPFLLCSLLSAQTVLRFETVLGNFEVQLYDQQGPERSTPLTAANFLAYVNNGAYQNSFLHRSVPGFVIQGGGFLVHENTIYSINTRPPVPNEPGNPNLRGTLAMAKLGGDPDSATSQWFINLADNRANLDEQNGGFTVFGHVLGDGMQVVDALAAVPTYQFDEPFSELPLLTPPPVYAEDLLYITRISIVPVEMNRVSLADGKVRLRWGGTGDAPVNVYRATNLVDQQWTRIASGVTLGNFEDANPPPAAFYKIERPAAASNE